MSRPATCRVGHRRPMFEPHDLLLRTSDLVAAAWSPRTISTALARGTLVRIRRGVYCNGSAWTALDDRQRHVLRACAVAEDVAEPVVAERSAAAIWDIPVIGRWPDDVTLLARYRGGGKSEPGVRRTSVGARGAPVVFRSGIPVTSLARTVVDLAAREGFMSGVVAADWSLASGISRDDLRAASRRRSSAYGSAVADAAVEFADAAAESAGESACRAAIFAAGFEVPELQVTFADSTGEMRPDYFWREARITGEFDGKGKYTRGVVTDSDPGDVVWREKKREDRLRRLHPGHVRLLWAHVRDPFALTALLADAGVPRRRTVRLDPGSFRVLARIAGANRARTADGRTPRTHDRRGAPRARVRRRAAPRPRAARRGSTPG